MGKQMVLWSATLPSLQVKGSIIQEEKEAHTYEGDRLRGTLLGTGCIFSIHLYMRWIILGLPITICSHVTHG